MNTVQFKANETVFKTGDASDCMYLIKSGMVGVYGKYGKKREQIAVLGKGKYFGEMGLIDNETRSADVVALEKCELVEVRAEDFKQFVLDNQPDVISIMKNLSARLRKTNEDLEFAAKTIADFMDENKVDETLAARMKNFLDSTVKFLSFSKKKEKTPKEKYAAGEVIFEQGEVGTVMFRILDGEVRICQNYGKADEKELAVLKKGDVFGEMAVIEDEKRSATAVAKTDVSCATVANVSLKTYLGAYPEEAIRILRGVSSKLRSSTASYLDALSAIAEFVKKEQEKMSDYVGGDDFINIASRYNYMADMSAAMINPYYNPYFFH